MNTIIFVAGKKQAGKDTFSKFFVEKGFEKLAFADELKDQLTDFLDIIFPSPNHIFFDSNKEEVFVMENAKGQLMSKRMLMQWYGQMMKDSFGQYYWVEKVIDQINDNTYFPIEGNIIISDCRFPYEIDIIKERFKDKYKFFTVYIEKDSDYIDKDISETSLSPYEYNFDMIVYNNFGLDKLEQSANEVMNRIRSIDYNI
jgi:hypothetical protein